MAKYLKAHMYSSPSTSLNIMGTIYIIIIHVIGYIQYYYLYPYCNTRRSGLQTLSIKYIIMIVIHKRSKEFNL